MKLNRMTSDTRVMIRIGEASGWFESVIAAAMSRPVMPRVTPLVVACIRR